MTSESLRCGAIAGACKTYLAPNASAAPGSALEGLLMDLTKVAKKASDELGPGVDVDALANHAVKVNVFHTVDFLLQYSAWAHETGHLVLHETDLASTSRGSWR